MALPKTKPIILKRLQTERKRLEQNLARLSPRDMLEPGVVSSSSVKDILAHLAHWESCLPLWLEAARRGENVRTPAADLTWKQVDTFNQRIYEAHRDQPLDEVLAYFRSTHEQFMHLAESTPEDELLERGRYAFIGGGAVYDWLVGYANHDLWAKNKIRQWLKRRQ